MLRKPIWQRTYILPTLVAVVSGGGLIFALLGDGIWDALSWLAVGLPVVIAAWVWRQATSIRGKAR